MSNRRLIEEVIRLGFKCGPTTVLRYCDLFHLARAVFNGHATLTKDGRATMMEFTITLKRLALAQKLYEQLQSILHTTKRPWDMLAPIEAKDWVDQADLILAQCGLDFPLLLTMVAETLCGEAWHKVSQGQRDPYLGRAEALLMVWMTGEDGKPMPTDEDLLAWVMHKDNPTSPATYLQAYRKFKKYDSAHWHREMWRAFEDFRAAFRRPR